MIKKVLVLTFYLFLIQSTALFSQEMGDYELYMNSAKDLSILYRGTAPLNYNFVSTGTYFAYSKEYAKGDLLYNNKLYKDVLLNINSHLDELYLFVEENGMPIMLNKDFVEKFNIGSRNYLHLKFPKNKRSLEDGFYELLWSNGQDSLVKKRKKNYEVRIDQSINLTTESKVQRIFTPIDKYYIFNNELEEQVKRFAHISSFYKVRNSKVRRFIKENNLDVKLNKDEAFKRVVEFINSSLLIDKK